VVWIALLRPFHPTENSRDAFVETIIELDGQMRARLRLQPRVVDDPGSQPPTEVARSTMAGHRFGSSRRRHCGGAARPQAVVPGPPIQDRAWLVDSRRVQHSAGEVPRTARHPRHLDDHVLHSEELTTVTRRLGPSLASDHLMVDARLASAAGRQGS
jgi:hypothetical protein